MPDRATATAQRPIWPAIALLAAFCAIGFFAPLIANDQPLLARVDGRLRAPALADLPLVGGLFAGHDLETLRGRTPPPTVETLLRTPVPYSYRGIFLDRALSRPDRVHLLGTDALGRDLLARMIHGTRPSLLVGLGATLLALLLGGLLGAIAGLRGGLIDLVILRVVEVLTCFPPFILTLAIVSAAGGGGLLPIVMAIAVSRATSMTRYVRGEILRRRGEDLWDAARATGASLTRLTVVHLLPLLARPLAVLTSFSVAHAILLESGLSFLGLGVEPPTPSWGGILAEARGTLDAAWWPVVFPSVALVIVLGTLSFAGERAAERGGEGQEGSPA